jgi:hypothetical protein
MDATADAAIDVDRQPELVGHGETLQLWPLAQ